MAVSTTVQDIYNVVADAVLEPFDSGASPGLSLGLVTLQDFLDFFATALEDFVNKTGLVKEIFTQQLLTGVSQYAVPEDMNQLDLAYVGSQWISHSTLFDLDNWFYNWRSASDIPLHWHEDGLPPKTVEVAAVPSYTGTAYTAPTVFNGVVSTAGTLVTLVSGDPFQLQWNNYAASLVLTINAVNYTIAEVTSPSTLELTSTAGTQASVAYTLPNPFEAPPFGIYGRFNGATQGVYTGIVSISGTAVTWQSGAQFDLNWNSYSPGPNMIISGVGYPIQSVDSATAITMAIAPGDGTVAFTVGISNDGNLTIIGNKGLPTVTYSLDSVIPVVPDSACPALAYAVLARIFSMDGEMKDMQRAAYCQARLTEYQNALASIAGMMQEIN